MRVDLGLIQLELAGRPDGLRPAGFESLLDALRGPRAPRGGSGEDFALDPAACAALMREGPQYYHRYLAAFHLQRYDLVARDTERNLRLFAFVVQHAARQRDKVQFDQYRPYVTMMHARARASQALARNDHARGAGRDRRGDRGDPRSSSATTTRRSTRPSAPSWASCSAGAARSSASARRPARAARAAARRWPSRSKDYEEAARLRDQLRRLQGRRSRPPASDRSETRLPRAGGLASPRACDSGFDP